MPTEPEHRPLTDAALLAALAAWDKEDRAFLAKLAAIEKKERSALFAALDRIEPAFGGSA